jgi:hypothetical protein
LRQPTSSTSEGSRRYNPYNRQGAARKSRNFRTGRNFGTPITTHAIGLLRNF